METIKMYLCVDQLLSYKEGCSGIIHMYTGITLFLQLRTSYIYIYIYISAGNLKVGKPMVCWCFFKTQHRFLNKKHLLQYTYANSLKYLYMKCINW